MKIVCVKEFKDKTSAKNYKDQVLINVGDVLECDDELAKERIRKGFVKEYVEPVEETEEVEPVEETEDKKARKRK